MPEAPAYVRRNAQRGLRLLEFAGDGLQASTVRAARRMAEGTVSDQKARLMGPWFARHEGDLDSPRARAYLAGDSDADGRAGRWASAAISAATSCAASLGRTPNRNR